MAVADILARKGRNVVTVAPTATIKSVAETLAGNRIGAVLVMDAAGAIAGILSERDIVRVIAQHGAAAMNSTAESCMSRPVRTCGPRDTEAELIGLMTEHRIRHLPVVENGKLAGMVSIGDVVKLRIEAVEQEAEQMKTYIATAG